VLGREVSELQTEEFNPGPKLPQTDAVPIEESTTKVFERLGIKDATGVAPALDSI
jgi:hypothetical protein